MAGPRVIRRQYYAALLANARTATWKDAGGKSRLVGLAIAIVAGLLVARSQDDLVLGIVALLVAALVIFVVVFLGHLVLAPGRLHQDTVETWETLARSSIDKLTTLNETAINEWRRTSEETIKEWRRTSDETLNEWRKSNASVRGAVLSSFLLWQLKEATGLRGSLAASEQAAAVDDGGLRAKVESWDGATARYVQEVSESEREFYVREAAVPQGSGKTWQGELNDFLLIREHRLQEVYDRYEAGKASGPVV